MSSAGKWKIETMTGGHPIFCEVSFNGEIIIKVRHPELRDLEYAVKRAIVECRNALPEHYKHEMD